MEFLSEVTGRIAQLLRTYPELAVFVVLALGVVVGRARIGRFSLGAVVGTLVVGLIVGQAHVEIPTFARTVFFCLFMFATGYRVGPQFFSALRRGGAKALVLPLIFCVAGLAAVLLMSKLFAFDEGFSAGLLSGALTQSSAIGTATEAIERLELAPEEMRVLSSHVPVADAVTYVFGTAGVAILLSKIAPAALRADLGAECEAVEKDLGSKEDEGPAPAFETFAAVDVQAFQVGGAGGAEFAGKTVAQLRDAARTPVHVQRVRRGRRLIRAPENFAIREGDVLVVSGRRETLLELQGRLGRLVVDREAMDIPIEVVKLVVTNRALVDRPLAELRRQLPAGGAGVHARKITRQGHDVPVLPNTRLQRGDVVELLGTREAIERLEPLVGVADRPTEKTPLVTMGLTIVLGILAGSLSIPLGGVPLGLGTSGGVLVAGLALGWLGSTRPRLGRVPPPAVWFMETLGLNAFIAMVGIAAGPHAVEGMQSNGLQLVVAGIVVTIVPHVLTLLVGRFVLRMNLGLLLGACAGAGTVMAGLQAVVEEAESSVPVLGFTVPYAISNVLLTMWGPVVVAIVHAWGG